MDHCRERCSQDWWHVMIDFVKQTNAVMTVALNHCLNSGATSVVGLKALFPGTLQIPSICQVHPSSFLLLIQTILSVVYHPARRRSFRWHHCSRDGVQCCVGLLTSLCLSALDFPRKESPHFLPVHQQYLYCSTQ